MDNDQRKYRKLFAPALFLIAAVAIFVLFSHGVFSTPPTVDAQPLNTFGKTLRVLSTDNYSPYTFTDEKGRKSGHDVELAILLANKLGMNLDLRYGEWTESIHAVEKHEADALLTCEYYSKDALESILVGSYVTVRDDFTAFGRSTPRDESWIFKSTLGVMKDGNISSTLKSMGISNTAIDYADNVAALQGVAAGECDYAIMRHAIGRELIGRLGLRGVKAYASIGPSLLCIGIARDNPELLGQINDALQEMRRDGALDRLQEKWLTTFVQPYTLGDAARRYPWLALIVLAALLFALYTIWSLYRENIRHRHEREAQSKELAKALELAKCALRAKTTFLNNVSHDIRTPMNAIIGYTRLATRNVGDEPRLRDCLGKIDQSSTHLLALINDVLDMSRIESGKTPLREKPESLCEIIADIESMAKANAEDKGLDFVVDAGGIRGADVLCDRLRLSQVLLNIISNAVKYTPQGGRITLRATRTGSEAAGAATYEFRVADTGIGMKQDFIATIFEPFVREDTVANGNIQGTGLGMAITKSIVDMMKGEIRISSRENVGTEVVVTLDLKTAPLGAVQKSAVGETAPAVDLSGKKALLVEDNAFNQEIATELLSEHGLDVDTAENGAVAVEKARTGGPGKYDVILMDIQMPVMNGYDAAKTIREIEKTWAPGTPPLLIIALSANAFEEDRQKSLEAGMDDHLPKPIDANALARVLSAHIGPGK